MYLLAELLSISQPCDGGMARYDDERSLQRGGNSRSSAAKLFLVRRMNALTSLLLQGRRDCCRNDVTPRLSTLRAHPSVLIADPLPINVNKSGTEADGKSAGL